MIMNLKKEILAKTTIRKYITFFGLVVVALSGVYSGYLLTRIKLSSRDKENMVIGEIVVQDTVTQKQDDKLPNSETAEPKVEEDKPVILPSPQVETKSETPPDQNSRTYSLNEAASIIVVVNKKNKLPSNYAPSLSTVAGGSMRPEAASALNNLLVEASAVGAPMKILSSYRSYNTQISTYNKWVNRDGKKAADRYSARPGHSEHQTGLAVDLGTTDSVCSLEICFGTTVQGKWLAAHAHEYGFIVRYESNTETITGYQYEPWHMRYLGVDIANAVVNSGLTLDQYYGVESGGY